MIIKRLLRLGVASLLSISSLLVISIPAAFAAGPFTCTWQGGGGNSNFSTAANWTGCNSAAPQPADDDSLIFPAGTGFTPANNDLTSALFTNITFTGSTAGVGITITGNAMTVAGNITDSSTVGVGSNAINADITMSRNGGTISSTNQPLIIGDSSNPGSDTLTSSAGGGSAALDIENDVEVYSNITGNYILALVGPVHFETDNSFSGVVGLADSTTLYADSANAFSGASLIKTSGSTGATVSGNGDLGADADIESGNIISPGDPAPGCLSSVDLGLSGTYQAVIGGTTACTDYDQITGSGTIDVTGGTLQVSLANGFTPTAGQTFTILNNTGVSSISGTFSGLAEGSTFTVGGSTFKISYVGGDGNDIVLTAVSASSGSTSGSGTAAASAPKTPDTGLALLAAHPLETFVVSTAAALAILVVARRLKPVKL